MHRRRFLAAAAGAVALASYQPRALAARPGLPVGSPSETINSLSWRFENVGAPPEMIEGMHRRGLLIENELPITNIDRQHAIYLAEVLTWVLVPMNLRMAGAPEMAEEVMSAATLEAASRVANVAGHTIGHVTDGKRFQDARGYLLPAASRAYGRCMHARTAAWYTTLEPRNWVMVSYHVGGSFPFPDTDEPWPTSTALAAIAMIDSALAGAYSLETVRQHLPEC